jgi:translation initiation factor 4E
MAEVASVPNGQQQVPLDTIPISPEGANMTAGSSEESAASKSSGDDQVRTVFHDPENFNVKHPLMHQWTLWFTKPPSGKVSPVLRHLELLAK